MATKIEIETVMNEVNNFASVFFGHCEKSKHFALVLGISLGAAPLGNIPRFQGKMFRFFTMPSK